MSLKTTLIYAWPLIKVVGFFILFLIMYCFALRAIAVSKIKKWADQNNLQLLEYHHKLAISTPFVIRGKQPIFAMKVVTPSGDQKKGWIKFGSFLVGMLSDKVEVIWEDSFVCSRSLIDRRAC